MEAKKTDGYQPHAIQLQALQVVELSIKSTRGAILSKEDSPNNPSEFRLSTGHSKYDQERHTMAVMIRAEIGSEENAPFEMSVELLGIFDVDEAKFPLIHIDDWAELNAPLVLYPYLREQVYNLTSRLGIDGMLLPLFVVPTFRITAPQQ